MPGCSSSSTPRSGSTSRSQNPSGRKVADFAAAQVIHDYGLSELLLRRAASRRWSEFPSSERFKQLFPEGDYTFTGETIAGAEAEEHVHAQPRRARRGPTITSPEEDATVAPHGQRSSWWLPDELAPGSTWRCTRCSSSTTP